MKLRFRETMSGWVQGPDGRKDFSFTVEALADRIRVVAGWGAMTLRGRADLEGVIKGAKILPGASLWVGLPFHRSLTYHLSFRDQEGSLWRFFGAKQVCVEHPLRSMTTLEGRLFCNGVEYGKTTLRFPLHSLPAFLLSWRIGYQGRKATWNH